MKNFYVPANLDCRREERVRRIVDLSRRRDRILEAHMLDLEGLTVLVADYEAMHMPRMAAELRRKLVRYHSTARKGGKAARRKLASQGCFTGHQ